MRVLVADDDLISRMMLQGAVEQLGHQCVVAEDGEQAWRLFSATDPDVLITDWMMPWVDGLELCRRVRSRGGDAYTYIILATSLVERDEILTGMEAGADDYLAKPLEPFDLQVRLIAAKRVTSLHSELARYRSELEKAAADLVQTNVELERHSQEVEAMAVFQRDFVAAASHELRTPLTAVLGYLEEVFEDREGLSDVHRGHLEVVQRNAKRLETLVDDLLVVNKIESGNLGLDLEPTEVEDLLRPVVEAFSHLCERKGIHFPATATAPLGRVLVDVVRTEQILGNLVSNAVKFTPAGGRIDVGARAAGDTIEMTVTDTGIGIAPQDLPRLFERFFRSASTLKTPVPGTGLGLTIAKAMVEAQGGELSVASTVGEGSTFTVSLPISEKENP